MSAKWFRRILNNSKPKNISNGGEKIVISLSQLLPSKFGGKNCQKGL